MSGHDLRDDELLAQALRAFHRSGSERGSGQHPMRTTQCPSIPELVSAAEHGTSDRGHVPVCPYCQKVIAMAWRDTCPGLLILLEDLAGVSPTKMALVEHLEKDCCRRCGLVRRSRLIRAAAESVLGGRESLERLAVRMRHVAAASVTLPAGAGNFAPPASSPFRMRVELPGGLVLVLRETDLRVLVVEIRSDNDGDVGRIVHLEVVGEREQMEADVVLEAHAGRVVGVHVLGRLNELAPRLGTLCEIVAVPSDDEPER